MWWSLIICPPGWNTVITELPNSGCAKARPLATSLHYRLIHFIKYILLNIF